MDPEPSSKTFSISAKNWSDEAHRFFKLCADAGNVEACYTLRMIRFYCLRNPGRCARAAFLGHVDAMRKLDHCLQDGCGVRQNITEGHRSKAGKEGEKEVVSQ